jgi:hypothetical protein
LDVVRVFYLKDIALTDIPDKRGSMFLRQPWRNLQSNGMSIRFLWPQMQKYINRRIYMISLYSMSLSIYFREPFDSMIKYIKALKPGGIIIISSYRFSRRAMAILRQLKMRYPVLDETQIIHHPQAWICIVFAPEKGES